MEGELKKFHDRATDLLKKLQTLSFQEAAKIAEEYESFSQTVRDNKLWY